MRSTTDDRRVIVIGSGPTGAMAAQTLVERGIPVTMLESGTQLPRGLLVRGMGRNLFRKMPRTWAGTRHIASGDPGAGWPHVLAPGGLSNNWTGAVPRFTPDDFCEGERLHERFRWPVSYGEIVPYYERVERLLGVEAGIVDVPNLPAPSQARRRALPGQWRRVASYAEAYGQGLAPVPLANSGPWVLARTGAAFNSYTRIVRALLRFPHFELILGAHALRVEWCGARPKTTSVLYADRGTGERRRLGSAAVVVAAGPLASTKLLLDSACSDFPGGLGDTEGLLGRYLHDHPHDYFILESATALPRLRHAAYLTRKAYGESEPMLGASCTLGNASTRDKILAMAPTKATTFGVVVFGTIVPSEDNFVRLHPTLKDDLGQPLLDLNIRYDEPALRNVKAARARLLAILDGAGYPSTVRWAIPHLTPGSSAHYGGTVRMHESPKYGMLDAWNRLHAVPNVIVADASCFTTGVEKNPTLTAMALSARAAERLALDLKAS